MSVTAPARTSRRGWLALVVLLVVAVAVLVAVGAGSGASSDPLSTTSTGSDGSRALARLLTARGTDVHETSRLDDAGRGAGDRTVLVTSPSSYDLAQLQALSGSTSGAVVLLEPDDGSLEALGVAAAESTAADNGTTGTVAPGCDLEAAGTAGDVAFDSSAVRYHRTATNVAQCYGGRLVQSGRITALGDTTLLTNARLADTGAAALDLDLLGRTSSLVWLLPGADAGGPTGSVWDVLPPHSGTAAVWLLVVGLLVVLWRGRRLGAPVTEPLPVVVRAAEVVHGRGRLYARSGARDRAAWALRTATVERLRQRLSLPRGTPVTSVEHAVSQELGRRGDTLPPGVLQGPVPVDDDALTSLAAALVEVEARVLRAGQGG